MNPVLHSGVDSERESYQKGSSSVWSEEMAIYRETEIIYAF